MRVLFSTICLTMGLFAVVYPAQAQCPDVPLPGSVLINEIQVGPTDQAFIEIWAEPGTSLECLTLQPYNGGTTGTECKTYNTIALAAGAVAPEDGLFVVGTAATSDQVDSKADLQQGPDGLALIHTATGAVVDTLAYGGALDGCEKPVVEGGNPAPAPDNGKSIGRYDHVDTDNNGKDFILCGLPTPGEANGCAPPPPCADDPAGAVTISELRVASGQEFVELAGPAGLDLGCFTLVQYNGGSAGDKCDPTDHALVGVKIGDNGLAVYELDLQKGPDAVAIEYRADSGSVQRMDSVVYGGELLACPEGLAHGAPAKVPPDEQSISSCASKGSDAEDFLATTPTPGEPNACPEPCPPRTGSVVINEVVYDPDDAAFVELKGDAGLDLRCYVLIELNGGQSNDQCDEASNTPLEGYTMPDDGYFVVSEGELEASDLVKNLAFQNGPGDAFLLVYTGAEGMEIVDSLAWGAALEGCDDPALDAGAGPSAKDGAAVARCPDGADTNDAAADVAAATASPGAKNVCDGGGGSGNGNGGGTDCKLPTDVPKINEIQTSTAGQAFIEIIGKPGTPLDCFSIVAYNGGTEASTCTESGTIELTDVKIPDSGFLVLAKGDGERADVATVKTTKADLQDGPDAVALVFAAKAGPQVVDSLVYGAELPACTALGIGEGTNAGKPKKGQSITRCAGSDTDDNAADFGSCAEPSPGAETTCACTGGGNPVPPGGAGVESPGGCTALPGERPVALLALFLVLLGIVARLGVRRRDQ